MINRRKFDEVKDALTTVFIGAVGGLIVFLVLGMFVYLGFYLLPEAAASLLDYPPLVWIVRIGAGIAVVIGAIWALIEGTT